MHASKTQHAHIPVDNAIGDRVHAAPLQLVPLDEEVAHSLIDVVINRPVGRQARPVAEVGCPTAQKAVQAIAHFRPGRLVAGHQKVAHFRLEALHAFLGRARAQIPFPVRLKPMRAERVA